MVRKDREELYGKFQVSFAEINKKIVSLSTDIFEPGESLENDFEILIRNMEKEMADLKKRMAGVE